MLKLNALELLNKKGKTKYWLYKQMGMSYQILDCKIEDLLVITEE